MNTYKRVGQILRETREERNLTVRDVSKETNIAMKFVLALENEDYSQFPAETFTLGFLKTYSDYLKLDTAHIISVYRGQQLEENQQPLEELTKPTVKIIALEIEKNKAFIPYIIAAIFLGILVFAFLYDSGNENKGTGSENNNPNSTFSSEKKSEGVPMDVTFIPQSVPEGNTVPFILTLEQGFNFSVNNQLCKIFIKSIRQENGENLATFGFNAHPDRKVFTFETKADENYTLTFRNPELESLRREIKVQIQTITEKSAKVLITLGEEREGSTTQPSGDVPIQVSLFFNKKSYAEFVIDGQPGEKGLINAGENKQLEARDRLEIKVGDGGAVEMVQNGKPRVKLGKPGKIIKKVFIRTQNPYDSSQYIIKESGE